MTSNPLDGNSRGESSVLGPEYFEEAIVNHDVREVELRGRRGDGHTRKRRLANIVCKDSLGDDLVVQLLLRG